MATLVQLGETDLIALSLGRLILQGIGAASNLDQSAIQISKMKQELDSIKEQLADLQTTGTSAES